MKKTSGFSRMFFALIQIVLFFLLGEVLLQSGYFDGRHHGFGVKNHTIVFAFDPFVEDIEGDTNALIFIIAVDIFQSDP